MQIFKCNMCIKTRTIVVNNKIENHRKSESNKEIKQPLHNMKMSLYLTFFF